MNDINIKPFQEDARLKPAVSPAAASKKIVLPWVILALALIGFLLMASWLYKKNQEALKQINALKSAQSQAASTEARQVVEQLGKILVLPQDEEPVIATVVDLDKLKGQPFFVNAQLQDKVVIYAKAGKAILYRPSQNKVVEVAPFSPNQNSVSASSVLGVSTTSPVSPGLGH